MISEKTVERYLVEQTKKRKGMPIKMGTMHQRSLPDRLVLMPGGRLGFAEIKGTNGRVTKGQYHMIKALKELGFMAEIIDSKEAVDEYLDTIAGV